MKITFFPGPGPHHKLSALIAWTNGTTAVQYTRPDGKVIHWFEAEAADCYDYASLDKIAYTMESLKWHGIEPKDRKPDTYIVPEDHNP